jgi:hypothetical protein
MFRFTIRDLCWLMVVIALAVACWIEHRRKNDWETNFRSSVIVLDDMKAELDRVSPDWRQEKRYKIDVIEDFAKKVRANEVLPSR